jgi:hypothetical protein
MNMDHFKTFIGDIFSNAWVWVGLVVIVLLMIRHWGGT